jgi:hypothetical protein
MKKLVRKIFRIKKTKKTLLTNVYVGRKTLQYIKQWETQKDELIIRSSFNRELYFKLLDLKKER